MAAEVEEVVVDADRLAQRVEAEEILPDPGDHLLDGIAGRRARRGVLLADRLGRRQRPPVDLAVGVERQLREGYEERRHHVLRQALAQVEAEIGRRRGRPPAPSGTYQATRRWPPAASFAAVTTASRTPGWPRSAVSTSPGSTRKPRTFTWKSARPRKSSVPSGRHRARSPVR